MLSQRVWGGRYVPLKATGEPMTSDTAAPSAGPIDTLARGAEHVKGESERRLRVNG